MSNLHTCPHCGRKSALLHTRCLGCGLRPAADAVNVDKLLNKHEYKKGGFFGASEENTVVAVDDFSLEIKRGECLGLVTQNGGAGRRLFGKRGDFLGREEAGDRFATTGFAEKSLAIG